MFALRCTRKLLDLIPGTVEEPAPSTTVPGDWYANTPFSRPEVVLLVSEKSLLPIVVPAVPIQDLVVRFVEQLANVLDCTYQKTSSWLSLDGCRNVISARQ